MNKEIGSRYSTSRVPVPSRGAQEHQPAYAIVRLRILLNEAAQAMLAIDTRPGRWGQTRGLELTDGVTFRVACVVRGSHKKQTRVGLGGLGVELW